MTSKRRLLVRTAGIAALAAFEFGICTAARAACSGDACSSISIAGTRITNRASTKVSIAACWYVGGKCYADARKLETTLAPGASTDVPALRPAPAGGAPTLMVEKANKIAAAPPTPAASAAPSTSAPAKPATSPSAAPPASGGTQVIESFFSGMTIRTSNSVANVEVHAKSLGPGACAVEFLDGAKTVGLLAPPLTYTPWTVLDSHIGTATFTIRNNVKCDTGVLAEIRYYK
jgi:hypothetical protein